MKLRLDFFHHKARFGVTAVLLLLIAACAMIRHDHPRPPPSYAFSQPELTTLGRAYVDIQAKHPGESGFRLLNNGPSALLTRAAMSDLAERSIDVQSYIYDADEVGVFLLERLIAAADRGVRVRMLLDDHELGLDDEALALINAHPNIEVRTFNPFPDRARWSRVLQLLSQISHLGKRMHNKVFAVDGQVAILGGRNIANLYFEGKGDANFRDFDLLGSGPVVKEVDAHFDAYWNSPIAVPVTAYPARAGDRKLAEYIKELKLEVSDGYGPNAEYQNRKVEFERRLLQGQSELIWAKSRAIAEPPIRQKPGETKSSSEIARALLSARQQTTHEMIIVSAYFVPSERGVDMLADLVKRGIRVRVLTNSLASTDVVAVHSGYLRYRVPLIEAGVELHEYRPDSPRPAQPNQVMRLGASRSGLHAKAIIFDRRLVWIGSANFDPRSRRINTEDGYLIESEALAARVIETMERDFTGENSWRLSVATDPQTEQKRLNWHALKDGKEMRVDREPGVGFLRQFKVFLFSLLLPEELL